MLAACTQKSDAEFETDIALSMHQSITQDLADIVKAAHEIQGAAPTRAWNPIRDHDAILQMQNSWKSMRIVWENIEGSMAPMFPALNVTLDARYEDFLVAL